MLLEALLRLWGKMTENEVTVSRTLFTDIRDFLIIQIFIDNAHRAGVIANMTIKKFQDCEKVGGSYCITVFKHKRSQAGPIRVILSMKLYSWLVLYVTKVRTAAMNDNSAMAPVFVTWNGNKFACSGGVSVASYSLWKKAGMKGRCGANRFRKAVVSAVHSSCDNEKLNKDLASLMGHSKSTAQRYYCMEEKMHSAGKAAQEVSVIMRSQHSDIDPKTFCDQDVVVIKNLFSQSIKARNITLQEVKAVKESEPFLENYTVRQLYDKLRAIIKEQLCTSTLPSAEKQTLVDKVDRLGTSLSTKAERNYKCDNDNDNGSCDIISATPSKKTVHCTIIKAAL